MSGSISVRKMYALCTQNVLSVLPIPLLFNALITVLTNYSKLNPVTSCDHLMSEPELRVLYVIFIKVQAKIK